MDEIREIIEVLKFKQELKRTKATPSEEIRIGNRNPIDGTYQARRVNGSVERGIRTSNGATATNQIVRGIQSDGVWGLDWRNIAQRPTTRVNKPLNRMAYLYSIVETKDDVSQRFFYIGGLGIKPIKLPVELAIPKEWGTQYYHVSANLTLAPKGVCLVDILYTNYSSLNKEETAYLIQYDTKTKKVKKTRENWVASLSYAGNGVWNSPVVIPAIEVEGESSGLEFNATGTAKAYKFIPFSGSYRSSGDFSSGSGNGGFTCTPWSLVVDRKKILKKELEYSGNNSNNYAIGSFSNTYFNKTASGELILPYDVKEPLSIYQKYSSTTSSNTNSNVTTELYAPVFLNSNGKDILYRKEYNEQVIVNGTTTVNIYNKNTFYLVRNKAKIEYANLDTGGVNFLGSGSLGYGRTTGFGFFISGFVQIIHGEVSEIPSFQNDDFSGLEKYTTWHKDKFYFFNPNQSLLLSQKDNPVKTTVKIEVYQIAPDGNTLKFKKKEQKIPVYSVKKNSTIYIHSVSIQP